MNTADTLNYLAEYAAPPAADRFERAYSAELRDLRDSLAADPKPEWDEARTDGYLLDQACAKVALDMDADGVEIRVAKDEDGVYFATVAPAWRIYSPCGARKWIVAADADEARTEAEAWVAAGQWEEGEQVHAHVEPYDGIRDSDNSGVYEFVTDDLRRESFTIISGRN